MANAIRNCAGGVVFSDGEVFLLKSDKGEWVMPKGIVREKNSPSDVALSRVNIEAGISAEILDQVGDTKYEFYSQTRKRGVSNKIKWYAMAAASKKYRIAFELGFLDGDYYPVDRALEMITHEQDKDILRKAWTLYSSAAK